MLLLLLLALRMHMLLSILRGWCQIVDCVLCMYAVSESRWRLARTLLVLTHFVNPQCFVALFMLALSRLLHAITHSCYTCLPAAFPPAAAYPFWPLPASICGAAIQLPNDSEEAGPAPWQDSAAEVLPVSIDLLLAQRRHTMAETHDSLIPTLMKLGF